MAVDLCVETYGAAVHLMDRVLLDSWFRQTVASIRPATWFSTDEVVEATEQLDVRAARAVWLVDVCGADYATASAELRTSRERFAPLLADARRQMLDELHS